MKKKRRATMYEIVQTGRSHYSGKPMKWKAWVTKSGEKNLRKMTKSTGKGSSFRKTGKKRKASLWESITKPQYVQGRRIKR